ncbi:MAG: glycosyltransferase family 4 protein, partial [Magnetococcales bacterium]|nr:glycosyltransferase family 4 protein [Magnetococcales bacterium]
TPLDESARRVVMVRPHAAAPSVAESQFARVSLQAWRELGADPAVLSRAPCPEPELAERPLIPCNPWFKGAWMRDWRFARGARQRLARFAPPPFVQSHGLLPGCDFHWAEETTRELLNQTPRGSDPVTRLLEAVSWRNQYLLGQERRLYASPWLRGVICGAERVKRELMEYYDFAPGKIHVIRHGIDAARFNLQTRETHRESMRRRMNIPPEAVVFLFAAQDFHRHGLGQLLYAIHHATPPDAILVVAGDDPRLRDYASVSQWIHIHERTLFVGAWPERESLLGMADALILPTLYDPAAPVAMEAMACGLPVLTSPESGAAELIVHGQSGLICDAVDEDALEALVRRLLDADERATLGEAGRQAVLPFTREAAVARMKPLYQQGLEEHAQAVADLPG